MTITLRRPGYTDDKTYVHANGQEKLQVSYIPDAFNEDVEVNKAKLLAMEQDLGIDFNKQLALA
jgi:hypothetical protein